MNTLAAKLSMVAVLLAPPIARAQEPPSGAKAGSRLKIGDYLRTDYLEKLDATHSPLQASVPDTAQLIQVLGESDGLHLVTVFNFHDGGAAFLLAEDGSFSGIDELVPTHPDLNILTDHSFRLKFDEFPAATYQFADNAKSFVAGKTLAGMYKDQAGQVYVFRPDGWAIFPDRKFKYEVGLDHVFTHYDYFRDSDLRKNFAFERIGDKLSVFKTSGDAKESVEKTPTLSLKLVPGQMPQN